MPVPPPDATLGPAAAGVRTLRIYFIKPSRYDDDGYVLRFRWGVVPNHTLTVLAGLNRAYAHAHPQVAVQTVLWDEMVDGIVSPAVMRSIRARGLADGVEIMIGIAGVQTNQYARGRDLALQCKALGLPVVIGGFHVSSHEPSREFLMRAGITVAVGEAEATWARTLDDFLKRRMRRCYTVADGVRAKTGVAPILVPPISAAPVPAIDARYLRRFFNRSFSTLDTSRGCPFACSYCAVKNVMGRTMRARDPRRIVEWMRDAHDRHGVRSLFVVDDDFYRNPRWEEVLTGIAGLRQGGRDISFMMQTDVEASADAIPPAGEVETHRHRHSRRFVELAAAAGCYAVFVGLESFNPANLERSQKHHNVALADRRKATCDPAGARARVKARYRSAVEAWHRAGVGVHGGYMIGMPFDGRGCGTQAARDLVDIGVDIASFFVYTVLPGTEDFIAAETAGEIIDTDFNNYDTAHVVGRHPQLSAAELMREYRDAYRAFYTWKRVAWSLATLHRVPGLRVAARYGMLTQQVFFAYAHRRGWHPMLAGIWRVRDPAGRREVVGDADAYRLYLGSDRVELPARRGQAA